MAGRFDPKSPADVARLIEDFPLAWVVSRSFAASPLPLLAELDEGGQVRSLLGHMARANPLHHALADDPRALILFSGPAGYVSPRLVSDRSWGPTWNYAVAAFETDVEFLPEATREALERLVAHLEEGHDEAWAIGELGARYDQLAPRIVAFRAHVRSSSARFKLGQDETPAVFGEILAGLGDTPLAEWMRGQFGDGQ